MVVTRKGAAADVQAMGICSICKEKPNELMIKCSGKCGQWYHQLCTGLSNNELKDEWICEDCVNNEDNEFKTPFNPKVHIKQTHNKSSNASVSKKSSHASISKKPSNASVSKKSSKAISTQSGQSMQLKLKCLEEKKAVEMKYLEEKYKLMDLELEAANNEIDEEQSFDEAESDNKSRVSKWLHDVNNEQQKCEGAFHINKGTNDISLSMEQIHARHVVSSELPIFSGKPEEWAVFLSNFENSTKLCGFTDAENLIRLQRALKGKAYERVCSMLLLPDLVPKIISTLKMFFGRPQQILNALINRLRSTASVNIHKLDTLIEFSCDVQNLVATMEAAKLRSHLNNPLLLQELIEKLPATWRLEWARHIGGQESDLSTFGIWIHDQAEYACSVMTTSASTNVENEKRKPQRVNYHDDNNKNQDPTFAEVSHEMQCFVCDCNHAVYDCERFKKMTTSEKWAVVNEKRLCRTCLKPHREYTCQSKKRCGINDCQRRHHPLLHKNLQEQLTQQQQQHMLASHQVQTSDVLYRIVPIIIYGNCGSLKTYAFLDEGSGPTLVERDVLKKLNIKGEASDLCLKWTDGTVRTEKNSEMVDLKITPSDNKKEMVLRQVRSVDKLNLPPQSLNYLDMAKKYKHLRGLPIESYENVVPQILIGVNNKSVALPLKVKEGEFNEPAATKTRLGWAIYGTCGQMHGHELQLHICECDNDVALQDLVLQSMQMESISEYKEEEKTYNEMEQYCQRKEDDVAFTAKLLWKNNDIVMPDNFNQAYKRMLSFEKNLQKDDDLKKRVAEHIRIMEEKGYIRKLQSEEIDAFFPKKWYLPIFAVKNPNKPNKLRIVWDAAAEFNGYSLNKCLLKGPDLVEPLVNVLFNFRVGKIAISADISEMFHRVNVDNIDQQSQRFLWRENSNEEPAVYVLTVMSFGATCSPSLAQYAKNRNAKDFEDKNPRAAKAILKRHYVDDLLDSVDSEEEAIQLANDVREIHQKANFYIRNWLSNSSKVLEALGEHGDETAFCNTAKAVDHIKPAEKVLGMWWNTTEDVIMFSLKYSKAAKEVIDGCRLPTKREFLRLIMSIFDPLGLIAFFTVKVKITFQDVWRSGITWDEIIKEEQAQEWLRWLEDLPKVQHVKIPRCYFQKSISGISTVQLHVFQDASEKAYGAVAYFRIQSGYGVEVSLVCSKVKVAPLKPISIPRMELMAASLGARLSKAIIDAHDLTIDSIYMWTDSKTVLQWIEEDARTYKQFVMFRIAEIQEITSKDSWRYVPTKMNVADLITKGNNKTNFNADNIWFSGPPFLQQPEHQWPKNIKHKSRETEELRQPNLQHVSVHFTEYQQLIDMTRFNKYERLLRSMAYVKRFIDRSQGQQEEISLNALRQDELLWAKEMLIKIAQTEVYGSEIRKYKEDDYTPSKSSMLRKLSPYVDEKNILRMQGRIQNANISEDMKNPIILPKNHQLTRLMVNWYHRKYRHGNHETVINEIFQNYYIPGLRSILRKIRYTCALCKIKYAQPNPPLMGQLPVARLSPGTRPFTFTGMDFFGPFMVTVGRRSEKRYGVIFTCLTSRAVHIEMAYSLSMSSCIMVIENFIARRGQPQHFFSDNGTNFRAAEKELKESVKAVQFDELAQKFVTEDTKWSFNPPASPHMGGCWERLVRSIKTVLYQIISPNTRLTDEKLTNLFCEVESIINNRPLTYLSLDTATEEALTPNHFLLGSSSGSKPRGTFSDRDEFVKASWRHMQLYTEKFWRKWVQEYLPDLTRRSKWFNRAKPLQVGDLVIIVDPNFPRHTWPKGKVIKTIIGPDGQVRSAFIKTSSGEYHRPVVKLAVLDVNTDAVSQGDGAGGGPIVFSDDDQDTGGENVANSPSKHLSKSALTEISNLT